MKCSNRKTNQFILQSKIVRKCTFISSLGMFKVLLKCVYRCISTNNSIVCFDRKKIYISIVSHWATKWNIWAQNEFSWVINLYQLSNRTSLYVVHVFKVHLSAFYLQDCYMRVPPQSLEYFVGSQICLWIQIL